MREKRVISLRYYNENDQQISIGNLKIYVGENDSKSLLVLGPDFRNWSGFQKRVPILEKRF